MGSRGPRLIPSKRGLGVNNKSVNNSETRHGPSQHSRYYGIITFVSWTGVPQMSERQHLLSLVPPRTSGPLCPT